MAIIFEEIKVMNKDKIKLWNKIRSSRGLKGEESQLAQDVFSECYDTLTAEVKQLEMSEESAQQHAVKCKAENEKLRLALAAIYNIDTKYIDQEFSYRDAYLDMQVLAHESLGLK